MRFKTIFKLEIYCTVNEIISSGVSNLFFKNLGDEIEFLGDRSL